MGSEIDTASDQTGGLRTIASILGQRGSQLRDAGLRYFTCP